MMSLLITVLCAMSLAVHVWMGFALGLSVDEAHYALYALHPALSYFDHPPLVGWVQMPFVFLGGFDWLMRVVPLALWGLTAYLLFSFPTHSPPPLSRLLDGRGGLDFSSAKGEATYTSPPALADSKHIGVMTVILFLLSPVHQLLGLALVPDSLLLPLTLWVMVLTWRLSSDISSRAYWIWLGLALGLAGLSKYTGVFLALGAAIVLLPTFGASLFKSRGVWLAALIAAVMISPVIAWNAQHEWASFAYQINHADGNTNGWQANRVLTYSLVQLVAYGCLPLLGLVVFLVKLRKDHAALTRLYLAFGLPLMLVTLWVSGKGAALPHWTAGAWVALLPLSAMGLQHVWQRSTGITRKAMRAVLCALAALQAIALVALAFAMSTGGHWQGQTVAGSVAAETGNPFADLYDWQAASVKARALQETHHVDALAVGNWTLASRLAWYGRPSKAWALDGKNKQFEMWFGKLEYGQSFIWVDWSQMPMQKPVGCQKLESSSYLGKHSQFDFYKCGRV